MQTLLCNELSKSGAEKRSVAPGRFVSSRTLWSYRLFSRINGIHPERDMPRPFGGKIYKLQYFALSFNRLVCLKTTFKPNIRYLMYCRTYSAGISCCLFTGLTLSTYLMPQNSDVIHRK